VHSDGVHGAADLETHPSTSAHRPRTVVPRSSGMCQVSWIMFSACLGPPLIDLAWRRARAGRKTRSPGRESPAGSRGANGGEERSAGTPTSPSPRADGPIDRRFAACKTEDLLEPWPVSCHSSGVRRGRRVCPPSLYAHATLPRQAATPAGASGDRPGGLGCPVGDRCKLTISLLFFLSNYVIVSYAELRSMNT
jgi:hypothetical protein